ncbi:Hypothetical predicted protein [Paramuricea clavata]|uniref:Uncharacterized protein n=1 Tax=Paramuricea clavata TaxID=317549 RepID=A0A6S7KBX9_PARCT|nr:Hypothetical predicted protein [Paramuricea clavata]
MQVLSETVSNIMMAYSSSETQETAIFLLMMDKFFYCCNSRPEMSVHKRKPFLAPYTSVNDSRFNFLKKTFLNYLANWKASIDERKGNFTKDDKSKMFLSSQTYQGLRLTVYSLEDIVKFLLNHGFEYVLTSKFSQDLLEEHFGRHRQSARRSENPSLQTLGVQENKFRIQRTMATSIREGIREAPRDPKKG